MAEAKDRFNVFISVDCEGVAGVVHFDETMRGSGKSDYEIVRKLMTRETNAAVEAALELGADEVLVRDAHGNAMNILPTELHPDAKLLRNWSDSPFCMMEGLRNDFHAAVFIGYHASAHTPNAVLKHTMNLGIAELKINGRVMSEASLNALIAGMMDVPVVFISGDKAICDQAKALWPDIETAPVKEGIGDACICIHPDKAVAMIRDGVKRGLKKRHQISPYVLEPPIVFEVEFARENAAYRAHWYPGCERTGNRTVRFSADHLMDGLRFFFFCQG